MQVLKNAYQSWCIMGSGLLNILSQTSDQQIFCQNDNKALLEITLVDISKAQIRRENINCLSTEEDNSVYQWNLGD